MEREIKVCAKCHKRIFEGKERYVHIEDWAFAEMEGESWWHLECFKKAMNRDLTLLEEQTVLMLQKAGNIFNNLPEEMTKPKEKEYVI